MGVVDLQVILAVHLVSPLKEVGAGAEVGQTPPSTTVGGGGHTLLTMVSEGHHTPPSTGDADQSPTRVLAPHTADPRSADVVITGTILLMIAPTGEAATALLHRASPREGIGIREGDIPATSLPGALRGDIHQVSLQACPLLEDDEAIHISVDTLRIAVPLGVVVSVHLMHHHTQGPPHPRCEYLLVISLVV